MDNGWTFERAGDSRSGWVRREQGYLNNGTPAYSHVAGPDDLSPHHVTYPNGYNYDCGWCYLGAPHSDAAHNAADQ